jgi:hypothetical protein
MRCCNSGLGVFEGRCIVCPRQTPAWKCKRPPGHPARGRFWCRGRSPGSQVVVAPGLPNARWRISDVKSDETRCLQLRGQRRNFARDAQCTGFPLSPQILRSGGTVTPICGVIRESLSMPACAFIQQIRFPELNSGTGRCPRHPVDCHATLPVSGPVVVLRARSARS